MEPRRRKNTDSRIYHLQNANGARGGGGTESVRMILETNAQSVTMDCQNEREKSFLTINHDGSWLELQFDVVEEDDTRTRECLTEQSNNAFGGRAYIEAQRTNWEKERFADGEAGPKNSNAREDESRASQAEPGSPPPVTNPPIDLDNVVAGIAGTEHSSSGFDGWAYVKAQRLEAWTNYDERFQDYLDEIRMAADFAGDVRFDPPTKPTYPRPDGCKSSPGDK